MRRTLMTLAIVTVAGIHGGRGQNVLRETAAWGWSGGVGDIRFTFEVHANPVTFDLRSAEADAGLWLYGPQNFVGPITAGEDVINDQRTLPYTGTYTLRATTTPEGVGAKFDLTITGEVSNLQHVPTTNHSWQAVNIGAVQATGDLIESNGAFTIFGAGEGLGGFADDAHMLYKPADGDWTITAQIMDVENTDPYAFCGITFREDLTGGSRHATIGFSAGNGLLFISRYHPNWSTEVVTGQGVTYPRWVRLVRLGDAVMGYHSADGVHWNEVGTVDLDMASDVKVGMVVYSKDNGTLCRGIVNNLTQDNLQRWDQDRFVIGAFADPSITSSGTGFTPVQADLDQFQYLADAHINTVIALETPQDRDNRYVLDYAQLTSPPMQVIQHRSGSFDLQGPTPAEPHMGEFLPEDAMLPLVKLYGPEPVRNGDYEALDQQDRDANLGYMIGDEPWVYDQYNNHQLIVCPNGNGQIDNVGLWADYLTSRDPSRAVWANLLPGESVAWLADPDLNPAAHADYPYAEAAIRDHYRAFAEIEGVSALSSSNYMQRTANATACLLEYYYMGLRVMAEEMRDHGAGKPWWTVVRCVEHFGPVSSCANAIVNDQTTRIEDYRFRVNSGLVYGAKGVVWFRMWHTDSHWGAHPADGSATGNQLYQNVQTVNAELSRMGSVLMGLNWLTTVHSSDVNNMPTLSCDGGPVVHSAESHLPTVNANTPAVYAIVPDAGSPQDIWAVGIFDGTDGAYLMVLNKDCKGTGPNLVTINLRSGGSIAVFNKLTGAWQSRPAGRSVALTVDPGDMALVRVRPDITPILNLLLLD